MVKNVRSLIFLAALALLSCGGETTEPVKTFDMSRIVASVDGKQFNLDDLNTMLNKQGWAEHSGLKRVSDTAAFNFRTLDALIVNGLVIQYADTFSIDTIFQAQTRIRDHQMAFVIKLMRENLMYEMLVITDQDVDTFYNNNRTQFFNPAAASAAQILISTNVRYWGDQEKELSDVPKDSIEKLARERMSEVLEKLDDGDSFEKLAQEYSHDKHSGQKGGGLGWVQLGQSPDIFDSTLFSLEPGEVSPAIQTDYGYHLIKMLDKRDSSYTPLDDALRANISEGMLLQIQRQYSAHFMDSLKNTASFKYNRKVLARHDTTYLPMEWLAIVNSRDTIYAYDFTEFARTHRLRNRIVNFDADLKIEALDGFVSNRVLVNEARKRGYFDKVETAVDLEYFTKLQQQHQYRLRGNAKLWEPTDEEIEAYYEDHLEDYFADRPLYVQHILFEDSMKAERVRREIEKGADFKEMAMEYYPGDEEVRSSLFDLGYISKNEMPVKFWSAAWLLDVGNVSRPVKTEYGFHLIKIIDRKPSVSLKDAKLKVRKRMIDERRNVTFQTWRANLLDGHKIDIDSALVREFVFQKDALGMPVPVRDSASVATE